MRWLGGFALLCVLVFAGVSRWLSMPSFTPLSADERRRLFEAIHQHRPYRLEIPMVLTWWKEGRPVLRVEAGGLEDALRQFAAPPDGRLKVDLLRAEAPLPGLVDRWPLLFSFGAVPGADAIALEAEGRRVLLLPDDLQRAEALAARALPQVDLEAGLDVGRVISLALERIGLDTEGYEHRPHRWRRVRVESYLDAPDPLPVVRGHAVSAGSVSAGSLSAAAASAGDYLVRHLGADGRFDYVYDPISDQSEQGSYSLPRHGGASSFLAQLAAHDPRFAEPAARAISFLAAHAGGTRGSVGEGSEHDLGGSALALVAAAYDLKAGDPRFGDFAHQLAEFVLWMQRPDGDFRHLYFPAEDRVDENYRAPYYSGEAALALALMASLPGGDAGRYAEAADRALDYLTGKQYDFFVGQFLFAEDHWTCMAADALWDRLTPAHRERYARFCVAFAEFLRRMQYTDDDAMVRAWPELSGAYGIGAVVPPHDTPTGSRSECVISVWRMQERLGWPSEDTRRQVLSSMQFLLARQLGDDQLWLAPDPSRAHGGIPQSDVHLAVRIDSVQHAGLALLRAGELLSVLH